MSMPEAIRHSRSARMERSTGTRSRVISAIPPDLVMPAFGANKNVMCFLDAIYVYLRARSAGATGPERPTKHDPKPPEFAEQENAFMR
jgi:hypothetical protein